MRRRLLPRWNFGEQLAETIAPRVARRTVRPTVAAWLFAHPEITVVSRDRHLQAIEEQDRIGRQAASGHNWRTLAEAGISRFKRMIGELPHGPVPGDRGVDCHGALNRILNLGRPEYVRTV